LHICILFSDFKKLKVDTYPSDFIENIFTGENIFGNILTKENFIEYPLNTENGIYGINGNDLNIIVDKIIYFLLNDKKFTFDESKRVKVILENHITNNNIGLKNMFDCLLK